MMESTDVVESAQQLVLAADVGGTHARMGLVGLWPDAGQLVSLLCSQTYLDADWPDLGAILQHFMTGLAPSLRPTRAVIAIAGYPQDGMIIGRNLPWPVSMLELEQTLGLTELQVVNDFAALAAAVRWLPADAGRVLLKGAGSGSPEQPLLVLGPGTGLGCAVLLGDATQGCVLPTEAGQMAFAPGTQRELQILGHRLRQQEPVIIDEVLSGPGLLRLYRNLADLEQVTPLFGRPVEVSRAALAGSDALAVEALEIFCGLLGSFSADLAILFGATGGVCLAGGILPEIEPFLLGSGFRRRFLDKGMMRPLLERIPVRLIEHGQLGILGAAAAMQTG